MLDAIESGQPATSVRSDTGSASAGLLGETQAGLRRAVNDARDQDCSWAEIADLWA